jgi:hypothetical protein
MIFVAAIRSRMMLTGHNQVIVGPKANESADSSVAGGE